jgi:2-polyprenyl-3-methyl-5-hydroxy-6-metoxy-1,4-benzoquinol methylase
VIASARLFGLYDLGEISTVSSLVFDGERAIPDEMRETVVLRTTLADHLRRYRLAKRYAVGRCVLDAACGSGYGSAMLKRVSGRPVVGVDYRIEALRYARQRYGRPGVLFVQADLDRFDWPYGAFEVVVSLETIEHLRNPRDFIRRVYERLPSGGVFAVSTPVTPTLAGDPWHRHEWSEAEVRAMVTGMDFVIVDQLRTLRSYTGRQLLQAGRRHPQAINLCHALRYPLRSLWIALYGWRDWGELMLVARKM